MRRVILTASCLSALAAAGCKNTQGGLPPATEWQTPPVGAASGGDEAPVVPPAFGTGRRSSPHGADPNNPHAGIAMGGSDPHAGLDMGGGGVDVTKLGLAGPDPNRPIDPTRRVTGLVTVTAAAKSQAKPGTAIFLVVKRAGASGAPVGSALAVDKLTWSADGVPFELTDAQAMIAGTELTGDVIVTARYDQDGDAISRQPGDITGQARVKIPADHVKLTLETVLP